MLALPGDYLWFWVGVAGAVIAVQLLFFAPIYWLLSEILRELRRK